MAPSTATTSDNEHRTPERGFKENEILSAVNDLYGGVTVDLKEPMETDAYVPLLKASIAQWRLQGKKGVWIKLRTEQANLVEPTIKEGFRYHHAERGYVMLVYWIPGTPDTLPENASHTVGIGAFVVNDNGEVLVVQEKSGPFKGTGVWKLPTGAVNQGEDICMAAIREVKEETGLETEFIEVLTFSQSHQLHFGKSDLFFVCLLRPLAFDVRKQDSEIEAAQWMPIEKYANQPYNQKHESFKKVAEICIAKSRKCYEGFAAVPTKTSRGETLYLYFNQEDFNRQ